jgi:hypothetical protein
VGLNATGESDLRLYYDGTHQYQELRLRRPLTSIISVIAQSEGIKLPPAFNYVFRALWQLTTIEKSQVAETTTRTVLSAQELGLVSNKRVLEELRQSSRETGIWATVTDQEITEAEMTGPPGAESLFGGGGMGTATPGAQAEQEPGKAQTGAGEQAGGERPSNVRQLPGGERPRLPVPPPRVSLGRGPS